MKLLHLTPKKNYKSIMKNGLIPTVVNNKIHLEQFNKDGLVGNKCIYTWSPDFSGSDVVKIIKDFIYCKVFIHPRNALYDKYEKSDYWFEYAKLGSTLYGDDEEYILFEIDTDGISLLESYWHHQTSGGSIYSTTFIMDTKYEHDDKMLYICTKKINPFKLTTIAEISSRVYKNNTIGVTYKRMCV